ncbi:unnamed protein product [Adineta ricciae]|uniref:BAG domain-containing protein n=1 Tax=Adineta ricciae TaxID=249248 RepID=A0A816ESA2_ADIRI|nr:unnamed protein product [Adineta ricciae]
MSSSNTSSRPNGCVSIPVEIVTKSSSNSHAYSRPTSSSRPYFNKNVFYDRSHSPSWEKLSTNRFQPRHSPVPSYDRLIQNSHFNQPFYQETPYQSFQPPMYDSKPLHPSRSIDDLLSPSMSSMRAKNSLRNSTYFSPLINNGFPSDSDFVDFNRHMDAFHDFPDTHHNFPANRPYPFDQPQSYCRPSFVHANEQRLPNDYQQTNSNQQSSSKTHDRSYSPTSQRDESPVRPAPSASPQQQQSQPQEYESDFKVTKNSTNPTTKSSTNATSLQSNDQQVPTTDSVPVRDPNVIALEKLEQIKQSLADLNQQVETFSGSTRDDRLYKTLDEQALKIMMRCDELVDVSADIKDKRKEMIHNVQTVLAKLESKVPINPTAEMETTVALYDPSTANASEFHEQDTST